MTSGIIAIKTGIRERQKINAVVIGKFAVHPRTTYPHDTYTVTHIATGLAVTEEMTSEEEGENLARKLDEAVTVDIEPANIYSAEYKAFLKTLRSVVFARRDGGER